MGGFAPRKQNPCQADLSTGAGGPVLEIDELLGPATLVQRESLSVAHKYVS